MNYLEEVDGSQTLKQRQKTTDETKHFLRQQPSNDQGTSKQHKQILVNNDNVNVQESACPGGRVGKGVGW